MLVTILGILLIAVGFIMLFTPGQGILAVIAGLALLATEYTWAKRLLDRARSRLEDARAKARELDPRVRRRRIIGTVVASIAVVAAVIAYLAVYGWPRYAVTGWNWLQGISSVVPELPGM